VLEVVAENTETKTRPKNWSYYALPSSKKTIARRWNLHTLNLAATEENLYDDLEDSSDSKGNRPETKRHFEEDKRLQCSTTT